MKHAQYILFAVGVLLAVLLGMTRSTHAPLAGTPVSKDYCYIWNTEAGDSATLRVTFSGDDGSATKGIFVYRPAEKDSKQGPFQGVVGPVDAKTGTRSASLWWNASGEGVTATEQLSLIFEGSIVSVGFGEMKDRGDGVFVYAHPKDISYSLHLQQTDCSDSAVK